jgi:hypothetical protein
MDGGDNQFKIEIVLNIHRPETKTEMEVRILCKKPSQKNQVHEDQRIGLNGGFWEPFSSYRKSHL